MSMDEYRKAARLLETAERLWRELGENPLTGSALRQRQGNLQLDLGNHRAAAPLLREALELARQTDSESQVQTALTNLAQAHMRMNDWLEAIDLLNEAIEKDSEPQPVALATLGICYFELNQFEEARRVFERVRELARVRGSTTLEAWATGELGIIAKDADENIEEALALYDRAIEMFGEARSHRNQAVFIENKGHIYRDQGLYEEALRQYQKAERTLDHLGVTNSPTLLKGRGQCLAGLGRPEEAIDLLRQALEAAEGGGDDKRIWQSHWEMAKVFRGQDAFEEADRAFELAIEQIERSRHDLRLGTFKTDFFQDKVKVYEQYVDFLAGPLEDPTRAFGIAEQARARSFLDSLAEVRADLHRALPAEVVESEEAILDEISLLQAELRQKDAAPERRELLREKEDQLQQLYLDLRTEHPAFHAFRYPEPADLGSVQNRLSSSEVLLQYFVGEEQSHLWVVAASEVQHHLLPGRDALEAAVKAVYQSLPSPDQPPRRLDELSVLLLPGSEWRESYQAVTIVPSGLLYYFPFEVLTIEGRSLGDLARTSYLPSASALTYLRAFEVKPNDEPRLLVLGDANYGAGPDLSRSSSLGGLRNLGALPFTRSEVSKIRSAFGYFDSTVLLGARATESYLKKLDLSDYSVVHLAAHGWIDPLLPSRSGIVLGQEEEETTEVEDGILQAREIFRLPLEAQLVTLSACQTALGKLVTGEGMVGLTQAFFFAGTPSVVASLWNVNDEATARFMSLFYGHLGKGLSKAEALRRARVGLRSEARYSHPYYWAPYILIGDGQTGVDFPVDQTLLWLVAGFFMVSILSGFFFVQRRRARRQ